MGTGGYYRYFVLATLTTSMMLNIADRLILSILLEDIKHDFALSDTQIGLITGLAFTALYITFSIPIAWLADRTNRAAIIAASIAVWSLMTALCGAATGFWTLFLARMGVGIGESGSGPAASSLLTAYFKERELGRAMGFYFLGSTIGTAAGLMVGGYLASLLGWRMAFLMLGVPGVVFALFVFLTIREPKGSDKRIPPPPAGSFSSGFKVWLAAIRALMANRLYVMATMAFACMIVTGYGFATWLAAIMLRKFSVSTADVGFYLGLAFVLGGIPGPILGGFCTDFLIRRDPRWRAWLPALATLACLPLFLACLLSTSFWPFLGLFSAGYLVFLIAQAPTVSLIQLSVRQEERAMASAVAGLFNNLIGQALGGFLIGFASTRLAPAMGTQALGTAVITISAAFALPAVVFYVMASRSIAASPSK